MAQNVQDAYRESWSLLRSGWRDRSAAAFQQQYALQLEEVSGQFDRACRKLEELTENLERALSDAERDVYL